MVSGLLRPADHCFKEAKELIARLSDGRREVTLEAPPGKEDLVKRRVVAAAKTNDAVVVYIPKLQPGSGKVPCIVVSDSNDDADLDPFIASLSAVGAAARAWLPAGVAVAWRAGLQAACSGSEQWQPAEFEEFVKRLGAIETFAAEFNKNNSCYVSMQMDLANRAIEIDALNAEELEASR